MALRKRGVTCIRKSRGGEGSNPAGNYGYSKQLNKPWNKSSNIKAILYIFAYADRALLAICRKSIILSLMTLFRMQIGLC